MKHVLLLFYNKITCLKIYREYKLKILNRLITVLTFLQICYLPLACQPNNATELQKELGKSHGFDVTKNIEWAKPNGHSLTMDIYIPQTGKESYPVLIVFHGGGWLINNNSIMNSMSEYIAQNSEYIVCNVNYRLLVDNGNTVTMNQMIEDAMGAVLWIKENIANYKGDSSKIIVTGDSAGGHLAEMVVMAGKNLETDGFEGDTYGFNPTYLPPGKTAEEIAADSGLEVQAAILSYPAIDIYDTALGGLEQPSNFFWSMGGATARGIFGSEYNVQDNPNMYKAVSPNYFIPESTERKLPPHFCQVGSMDDLITPEIVQEYVELLQSKGHHAEFWIHEGRPHAYLDSGHNDYLGIEFTKDAPIAIDKMIDFMDRVLK